MLTVAKIAASGATAYGQYLEGRTLAPEMGDYYLKSGERVEAPGRWTLGQQGAAALGVDVSRPVGAEEFRALMSVRNPATGGQLRAVNRPGVVGDFWPWKRGWSYANRSWSWKVSEPAVFG